MSIKLDNGKIRINLTIQGIAETGLDSNNRRDPLDSVQSKITQFQLTNALAECFASLAERRVKNSSHRSNSEYWGDFCAEVDAIEEEKPKMQYKYGDLIETISRRREPSNDLKPYQWPTIMEPIDGGMVNLTPQELDRLQKEFLDHQKDSEGRQVQHNHNQDQN